MPADGPSTEHGEWRAALLTYGPAILVAFILDWTLTTQLDWTPRRALLTSIGVGIALALILQRVLHRRDDGG